MNPYIVPMTCSVCDGSGMGHIDDLGKDWQGVFFSHKDPTICAEYLEEKERQKQPTSPKQSDGSGI